MVAGCPLISAPLRVPCSASSANRSTSSTRALSSSIIRTRWVMIATSPVVGNARRSVTVASSYSPPLEGRCEKIRIVGRLCQPPILRGGHRTRRLTETPYSRPAAKSISSRLQGLGVGPSVTRSGQDARAAGLIHSFRLTKKKASPEAGHFPNNCVLLRNLAGALFGFWFFFGLGRRIFHRR